MEKNTAAFPAVLEPPRAIGVNEVRTPVMDEFGRQSARIDRWCQLWAADPETHYWRANGDTSGQLERFLNAYLVDTGMGEYIDGRFEKFTLTVAYDAKVRSQIDVRRRIVETASSGEPIFPVRSIALCEFVEQNEPAGWLTGVEWSRILQELRPLIEEEKRIKNGERALIANKNRRMTQAHADAENPTASLAAGISAGVAAALAELGIKPKQARL